MRLPGNKFIPLKVLTMSEKRAGGRNEKRLALVVSFTFAPCGGLNGNGLP